MKERTTHKGLKVAALACAATLGLTAFATTYTWTGGGNGTSWSDPANWGLEEGCPNAEDDEITIATDASIVNDSGSRITIGTLTIDANVTLSGTFYTPKNFGGTGTLTLSDFTFQKDTGVSVSNFTIACPVVAANTVTIANTSSTGSGTGYTVTFTGNVSGDGTLTVGTNNKTNGYGFLFRGGVVGFTGKVRGCNTNNGVRDGTRIKDSDNASEDAVYELGYTSNSADTVLEAKDGTVEGAKTDYKFGALSGLSSGFGLNATKSLTLTIGKRSDVTSDLTIKSPGTGNTIIKVGSGEMKFAGAVATLNVSAGTVTLTDSANIPAAIAMADGTTLAFADDYSASTSFITPAGAATIDVATGKNVTLADAFAALTKTGDGILTLTTVPTGTITVSAGCVYLPAESDPTYDTTTTGKMITSAGVLLYSLTNINVWTGEANDNTWATDGNWSKGTAPSSFSEVVIIPETADDTLTITGGSTSYDYTGVLTIKRDVTLTGRFYIGSISGDSTLTVDEVIYKKYDATSHGDYVINCPLNVVNSFKSASYSGSTNGDTLVINGKLTGDGQISEYGGSRVCCQFTGDTSEFAGKYYNGSNAQHRDNTQFKGAARGSALATWRIGCTGNSNGENSWPFQISDTTYYFGRLDGATNFRLRPATGATVEVGALAGSTSTVTGTIYNDSNTLRKVGETSTLDLTLTTANGAVEAEAGTLNLKGGSTTAYAPVSCTITGKGATVVVADAVANSTLTYPEDDPETTDVDESEGDPTGTAFAPVLSAELQAAYCELKTEVGDGVTTYSLYDIAQVGETTYKTIADAVAAATGEDMAITVLRSTEEPVVLTTVGQTITLGEYTIGAVSGAAGVGVTLENGVYTAVANTEATWVGASAGANWDTASNWSTGFIPDSETAVKFTGDAVVYLSDTTSRTHKFKSLTITNGYTVELARADGVEGVPCVEANGYIYGNATLKLTNCGLYNNTDARIEVYPQVELAATGTDYCYFDGQTIDFKRSVTGTGTTKFNVVNTSSPYLFRAGVTIPDGTEFVFAKTYPQFASTDDATLTGAGTIVLDGQSSGNVSPNLGEKLKSLLQNAAWEGVFEFRNCYQINGVYWMSNFGNSGSTIRYSGTGATYLYTSLETSAGGHNVGTLDIAAGANIKINGTYGNACEFLISSKLTGSGKLTIGIAGSNNKDVRFTGDVSEFAGSIAWASDSKNTRLVFGSTTRDHVANSLVVGADAEVTIAAGQTWTFTGGAIVDGKLTIATSTAEMVCKYSPNYVRGSGTIVFPQVVKTFSNFGYHSTDWTGTTILGFSVASGASPAFNNYGTAYSSVGTSYDWSGHLNGSGSFIPTLNLVSNFTINNGTSTTTAWEAGKITSFSRITGENNLNLTWVNPNSADYISYTSIGAIDADGFEGTLNVGNKNSVAIGAVEFAEAPSAGECLVALSVADNGKIFNIDGDTTNEVSVGSILTTATVAGQSTAIQLMRGADGIYVPAASVTTGEAGSETTTYYATLAEAAAVALAAEDHVFTVLDGTTEYAGWTYDANAQTFTKAYVAQVGETQYLTLEEALAADGATAITLIGSCGETVTIANTQTLDLNGQAFTGTVNGAGTITASTSPETLPTFGENWTGRFVMNWSNSTATKGTDWAFDKYGVSGSTVVVGQEIAHGYLKDPSEAKHPTMGPGLELAASLTICNGYSVETEDDWISTGNVAYIPTLSSAANTVLNITWETTPSSGTGNKYAHYEVGKLASFAGSITLGNNIRLKIDSVDLTVAEYQALTAGTCVVPITITAASGTYTAGKVVNADGGDAATDGIVCTVAGTDVGLKLVFDTDGLYLAVASMTVDDDTTYFTSWQDAVDAAEAEGVSSLAILVPASSYPTGWYADTQGTTLFKAVASAEVANTVEEQTVYETMYYPTLAGAIAAVADGKTVTLLADTTEAIEYTGASAFTLDLNGKDWTVVADCDTVWAAFKNNGGTVTFKDSVGTGEMRCDAGFVIWARLGSVVIESGNYVNDSNDNYTIYTGTNDVGLNGATPATVTITGGTFVNENSEAYIYKATWHSINLNVFNYDATTATQMATTLIQVSGGSFTWDPALGDDNMGGSFVASGYESTLDAQTGYYVVTQVQNTGIDPTDENSSQEVKVDTTLSADEQVAAAKAAATVTIPSGVSGVDAATYKSYFKLAAVETSAGSGVYTVTIAGLADEVVTAADTSALTAVQAAVASEAETFTVAVPVGLYYKIQTFDTLGGTAVGTASGLSDGTTTAVTKPTSAAKGFVKVEIGATAFQ